MEISDLDFLNILHKIGANNFQLEDFKSQDRLTQMAYRVVEHVQEECGCVVTFV